MRTKGLFHKVTEITGNYFEKQTTTCICSILPLFVTAISLYNNKKQNPSFQIIRFHNRISNIFKPYGSPPQITGNLNPLKIKKKDNLKCQLSYYK